MSAHFGFPVLATPPASEAAAEARKRKATEGNCQVGVSAKGAVSCPPEVASNGPM
jgi:hypothetical protein